MLNFETVVGGDERDWIIFIHGAGGSLKSWKYQQEALATQYNLLLLDLRDHGASKNIQPAYDQYRFAMITEDILQVVDHLGIRKAHFITLSFGSVLMQDLAMNRPQLLRKVVMAGGIFKGNIWIRSFVHLARFFNIFLSYPKMYSLFSYLLMPRKRNQKARRLYQLFAQRLTQQEYLKWVGLYDEFFRLLGTFYRYTVPGKVLIVMGKDDYVFLKGARDYVRRHPQVVLKELDETGHICNMERPDMFNQLVKGFLQVSTSPTEIPVTKEWSAAN